MPLSQQQSLSNKPIHDPNKLAYTDSEKANIFADLMENQFSPNPEPYDNHTIDLVNRYLGSLLLHTPLPP